jgi:hypothetical protein
VIAALLLGASARSQQPPPAPAQAQGQRDIQIGGGDQARFAVPDCVPRSGDEAAKEACRTITEVLRNDLKFEL